MKKQIAFVVQRYGPEINGGSELYCRQLAERLAGTYDVSVLTSCAVDYLTWKNEYEPGESNINGVRVKRYPVDRPRKASRFDKISLKSFGDRGDYELGLEWQRQQGPHCPGLLRHLAECKSGYHAILFMTYLYSPTYFGIHIAPEKSLLIPTAHDEPPIYQSIFASEFHLPKYIIYNTLSEKKFVTQHFHNGHIPSCIAGVGVDINENAPAIDLGARFGITGDYMLYVGRIDEGKNCPQMLEYFRRYRDESGRRVKLVLAGKSTIDIPKDEDILHVGFVTEDEKVSLYRGAKFMLLHSAFESLSISTLEAMYLGTPVLLNGNCEVLRAHAEDSGAGFAYKNYDEFAPKATALLNSDIGTKEMGENGRTYVEKFYRWDAVLERITKGIEYVSNLL